MRPPTLEGSLLQQISERCARAALTAATAVLAIAATGLLPAAAQTGEEATWTQFQGGPGHTGLLADGPQPPYRVRWRLPAPAGEALSAAIVVGDRAISVGSQAVYGVDVATGTVAWELERAGGPLSPPAFGTAGGTDVLAYLEGPQPSGEPPSPSPDAEAGEPDEEVSELVGVDLDGRSELWRTPLEGISRSGVTIDGEEAYVGDQAGNVYAISLSDGTIAWTASVGGRVEAPVAAAEGTVFVVARDEDGGRAIVSALDATTGERAWAPVAVQAGSTASSAAAAGASVVVGSADRFVRAVSAENGSERWASLVVAPFSPNTSPAFDGRSVFIADLSGGIYRLDATSGERAWSHQLNEVVFRSSPVVSGSSVLVGLNDGRLVALDASSGHLVWESEPSSGLVGTIALSSDAAIAVKGGRNAGLIAFEHDPDGALVDVPSPTELRPGTTFGRYALAAVIVFVLAFVPGVLARRRFGVAVEVEEGVEPEGDAQTEQDDQG